MFLPRNQGIDLTGHWNTAQRPASPQPQSQACGHLGPSLYSLISDPAFPDSLQVKSYHSLQAPAYATDCPQWIINSSLAQWGSGPGLQGRTTSGRRERALSAGEPRAQWTQVVHKAVEGQAHRNNEHIRNLVWSHYFCQVCASFIARWSQSSHSVCSSPGYCLILEPRQESSGSVLASVLCMTLRTPSTLDE